MIIPKNLVSTTFWIIVFSMAIGILTSIFIKFVSVKLRDNLFALSQVTIFASSSLAMETRWSVFL